MEGGGAGVSTAITHERDSGGGRAVQGRWGGSHAGEPLVWPGMGQVDACGGWLGGARGCKGLVLTPACLPRLAPPRPAAGQVPFERRQAEGRLRLLCLLRAAMIRASKAELLHLGVPALRYTVGGSAGLAAGLGLLPLLRLGVPALRYTVGGSAGLAAGLGLLPLLRLGVPALCREAGVWAGGRVAARSMREDQSALGRVAWSSRAPLMPCLGRHRLRLRLAPPPAAPRPCPVPPNQPYGRRPPSWTLRPRTPPATTALSTLFASTC